MSADEQPSPDEVKAAVVRAATSECGFDLVGVSPAVSAGGFDPLADWLDKGYAGSMTYMERRREAYRHPAGVLHTVRSVVMLGLDYRTDAPAEPEPNRGRVSRYAWGGVDYHDLIRAKLKRLAGVLHDLRPGCKTRGVVDTAPLLERDFARLAGLGWFGKNTLLLSKLRGSLFFLAALLTDVALPPDAPHETSHCGTCTRCLDACPTDAFPEPYVLDARRCISYLTIEHQGHIPSELRDGVGDWLFGCDVCQDVCPWNSKAPLADDGGFRPRTPHGVVDLIDLCARSDDELDAFLQGTPLSRPGRDGLRRNAAIVLGNVGDEKAIPVLVKLLDDSDAVVRSSAAWALGRVGGRTARAALEERLGREENQAVRDDIVQAIASLLPSA